MNLSKELERQKLISRLTQGFKVQDAGKPFLEQMREVRDELEKTQWEEQSEDEIELSASFSNLVVDDVGGFKVLVLAEWCLQVRKRARVDVELLSHHLENICHG